jgi:predicted NAD/FAD-dependent oxidoreductase
MSFGCGVYAVAGSVCASLLAAKGLAVHVFDSGRGPGGRMSQRRYASSWFTLDMVTQSQTVSELMAFMTQECSSFRWTGRRLTMGQS